MKYSKLINKIENFYKLAGTLEYPVKMHQEISTWAHAIYCEAALSDLQELIENNEIPEHLMNKAKMLRAFLQNKIRGEINNPQDFLIDFSDISYFTPEELDLLRGRKISVEFILDDATEDGEYSSKNNTLYIYRAVDPALSEVKVLQALEGISKTIRHELQHVVQYYSQFAKNMLGNIIGEPSKTISPNQEDEKSSKIPHTLQNVEFYTMLSDVIDELKSAMIKFPVSLRRLLFETTIGNVSYTAFFKLALKNMQKMNPAQKIDKEFLEKNYSVQLDNLKYNSKNLKLLQDKQPEKYHKFVKELYKAISNEL